MTATRRSDDRETIQAEARAWARRLKLERPTTEDAAAFRRWRAQSVEHARAWAEASSDWRDMGRVAYAFRSQHARPPAVARPGRRLFLGAALSASGAAAVAAIVHPPLGLWPSWSELGADYRTATGEQREIELAGRVQLALNTQTSLTVPSGAAEGITRIELLAGEAAVQNRHANAVELAAGAGRIWLEAGAMEVRRVADRVRVLCTDGAVELRHPSRSGSVVLQARQQVSYGRDDVGYASAVDIRQASAWRQGVVVFNNTPLPEAVAEINRYRPGRVMLMGDRLAGREISGRFRIGALDEAVVQIQQLFNTGIRTVGGVVLLG